MGNLDEVRENLERTWETLTKPVKLWQKFWERPSGILGKYSGKLRRA